MTVRSCFRTLVLSPLFLVSCESQETKSLQERRDYFDRQIAIYEERVQKAEQKLKGEIEDLEKIGERSQPALKSMEARDAMLAQIRELIAGLAALENSMFEKAGLAESYKQKFRPKSIAPQTKLGDLTLTQGTSYKSVVVKETTSTHLSISHAGGFSQIPFTVLPDSIRSQISTPPAELEPAPNPADVIARKPDSIKSDSEHAAERDRAIQEQEKMRSEALAKSEAERAERSKMLAERDRQIDEDRKAWDKYNSEIASVDTQIRALEMKIANLEREKLNMEYANQTGSVKLARADFIKKLRPFEDQIKALRSQLVEQQAKRAGLRPPVR